ncbi:MAG: hypothetical protein ACRD17_04705 [Terriglobales bacterium]
MADKIEDGIRKAIQDLLVPELRQLRAEFNGLRDEVRQTLAAMDKRLDGMDKHLDGMDQKADARHAELLSAIREGRAATELAVMRELGALRERVAVLETRRS